MAGGRPATYTDPLELQTDIDLFFAECTGKGERPTVTGLALFLGFCDKKSLYDYRDKEGGLFLHPIKRALTKIEYELEKRLENNSVAGIIFGLKNMGWTDKTQTEISGELKHSQVIYEQQPGNEPVKD